MPVLLSLLTLAATLFLNGNISLESYFPPLGKVLNPHGGFWQNAERGLSDLQLESSLVQGDITIVYDERYVPHVYAQSMEDALFAQGYLEAQNRLFQMDMMSRSVSGNLSEVIAGNAVVFQKDVESVRKGHRSTAAFLMQEFKKDKTKQYLKYYTEGVNHYIAGLAPKDYPIEYKLMDFTPSPWTEEKSIYVLITMADMLAGRADDFENNNLREVLGPELHAFLYGENFQVKAPVIPEGTVYGAAAEKDSYDSTMHSYGKIYKSEFSPNRIFGAGSNNWAVAGEKSKSGMPILANDPHLGLSLPSIWYEIELHTPEMHAHGVSVPGLAGCMIGFNENIAWGMTNVGHDIKDFYKIKYTDASKSNYVYGETERAIEIKDETIKRRGAADHVEKVAYTAWGPIVHGQETGDYAMHWVRSYRATAHEPSVYVDCMRSKSYDEFVAYSSGYVSPAQNFICVDRSNIGIRVNGAFPAKKKGDGKFVKDGSNPEAGYDKFIPIDQLPHSKNPERGFVSSANQRSTAADYPYYYNGIFATYRGERINSLLADGESFTPEDFKKFQLDDYSIKAHDFLPLFLAAVEENDNSAYKNLLQAWDFRYTKDSEAATLFYRWYTEYKRMIFDEFIPHRDEVYLKYPFDWKIYELTRDYPEHKIYDKLETDQVETRDDIIRESFVKACETMDNMTDKRWSQYRPLHIDHVAKISGLGRGNIAVGGAGEALNATRTRFGPSWRMVVGMGDKIEAYGVYPGGQSGNPASKYYTDMLQHWIDGKYYKIEMQPKAEELTASRTLTIQKKS